MFTFIAWTFLLTVGMLGIAVSHARPAMPATAEAMPPVEAIDIELINQPLEPTSAPDPPAAPREPLALPDSIPAVDTPPLIALAEFSTELAFALPIDAPARVVDFDAADFSSSAVVDVPNAVASTQIQNLVFGRGDGNQPAPTYPWQAQRQGHEGTVTALFAVGTNGRVKSVEIETSSSSKIIDDHAERWIRKMWRFPRGTERRHRIALDFKLR